MSAGRHEGCTIGFRLDYYYEKVLPLKQNIFDSRKAKILLMLTFMYGSILHIVDFMPFHEKYRIAGLRLECAAFFLRHKHSFYTAYFKQNSFGRTITTI